MILEDEQVPRGKPGVTVDEEIQEKYNHSQGTMKEALDLEAANSNLIACFAQPECEHAGASLGACFLTCTMDTVTSVLITTRGRVKAKIREMLIKRSSTEDF